MRIGTWNLAGRWSAAHRRLLEGAGCDVWLLTEVPAAFDVGVGEIVRSRPMPGTRARSWAAVWSERPLVALASPHEAAALVRRDDLLLCACVLPWRGARPHWPDEGASTAAITLAALGRLRPALTPARCEVVWGGDWNHAMDGREYAGTKEGRGAIHRLLDDLGLAAVTAAAPHRNEGLLSIDHVAVPRGWVTACERVVAEADGARLSDHDAYVVDAVAP